MTKILLKLGSVSVITLAAILLSAPVLHAQTVGSETPAVESPNFISGGVGEEDRAELEAVQKNYNLKIVFAGEGGIFLDDIHVVITDAAKNTVLTTDTEGPILLAKLKPGKYVVSADVQGITKTQNLTIKKNGQTNITIRFPIGE